VCGIISKFACLYRHQPKFLFIKKIFKSAADFPLNIDVAKIIRAQIELYVIGHSYDNFKFFTEFRVQRTAAN
jgi:hypothetical protein